MALARRFRRVRGREGRCRAHDRSCCAPCAACALPACCGSRRARCAAASVPRTTPTWPPSPASSAAAGIRPRPDSPFTTICAAAVKTVARRLDIAEPDLAGGAPVKRGTTDAVPRAGRGQAERHDLPRRGEPRPAHLRREAHRAHGHSRSTRLGGAAPVRGAGHPASTSSSPATTSPTWSRSSSALPPTPTTATARSSARALCPMRCSTRSSPASSWVVWWGSPSSCRRCTRPSRWAGTQGLRRGAQGARYRSGAARHRGVLRRASGHRGRRRRGAGPSGTSRSRCRRAPISARSPATSATAWGAPPMWGRCAARRPARSASPTA